MKTIAMKFIGVLLCALFLLTAVASGLGVGVLIALDLYRETPEQLYLQSWENYYRWKAMEIAESHVLRERSDLPEEVASQYLEGEYGYLTNIPEDGFFYRLTDSNGAILSQRYDEKKVQDAVVLHYTLETHYPMVAAVEPVGGEPTVPDATTEATTPDATGASEEPTAPLEGYMGMASREYQTEDGSIHRYRVALYAGPQLQVTMYLLSGSYDEPGDWAWKLCDLGHTHRFHLIWVCAASLFLFAVVLVYLCWAAGRKPGTEEIRPGGLNRLPLDLYGCATVLAVVVLVVAVWDMMGWGWDSYEPVWLLFAGAGAGGFLCSLLITGFLFACAAQMKLPGCQWLKKTLVGTVLLLLWRFVKWVFTAISDVLFDIRMDAPDNFKAFWGFVKKVFRFLKKAVIAVVSFLKKLLLGLYKIVKNVLAACFRLLGKCLRGIWYGLRRMGELLPLTWQWLLVSFAIVALVTASVLPGVPTAVEMLCIAAVIAIVMYAAYCFGLLLERTKSMSEGELDAKLEDKFLLGSFREYAIHLNALADVAVEAARKQMKSERMKAELITNVSHDIKTPLTSIINYVDLLQKTDSPQEAEEYLEVLSRQAQRMKKLLEDLMEMSKASTGNMAVELHPLDAAEAITQALGEFSGKLEQAGLTPVFQMPQEPVTVIADGRLTWRVLSNLLSNAVKYALPGTRLYIDLTDTGSRVEISLKNISREPLNVSSEELMERFVRGDASRNTEGSGLGLNIARSLMDLQKGQMELLVDGDLFKVTLRFPGV